MTAIVASLLLFASALPTITTAQHLDVSGNGWCKVDIKYPQISGIAHVSLGSTINAGLRKRFLEYPESYDPYQAYFQTPVAHPSMVDCGRRIGALNTSFERRGLLTPGSHLSYSSEAQYSVAFESGSLVSIVGSGLEYFAFQPYPNTYWWTANVNLSNGHFLSFDDIFRTDALHRKRLDDLIYESLRRDRSGSSTDLANMFRTQIGERGDLQPALCAGGIRFFSIFHPHVVAAATTFVIGRDLLAAGVVKDPVTIALIMEARRGNDACGAL
jgi:hypothetical protein